MASKLDMALEDLVKTNPKGRRGGGPNRSRPRTNRNANAKKPRALISASAAAAASLDVGSKLLISNLHFGVTESDLKELFSTVGPLKKVSLAFDEMGKSKGSAEVVFVRKNDAILAMKKYNDVALDGRPMKMEITTQTIPQLLVTGKQGPAPGGRLSRGPAGRGRGGSRGRGGRNGGGKGKPKSAEELDAEMSEYMTTQTNEAAGEDVAMKE